MSNVFKKVVVPIVCTVCIFSACSIHTASDEEIKMNDDISANMQTAASKAAVEVKSPTEASLDITTRNSDELTNEEIELIALVTMAEAEGECEEGKRLVIDTILNRVDSDKFPDNVYDVVYQKYHFSSMWNGRVQRCEVKEDICDLVKEELKQRTNYDVIYFTAGRYSNYGVPMFQVGNHYFSSEE